MRGKVYIYIRNEQAKSPPPNTTKVLFDFDDALVAGPPETQPDQHGSWRASFDLIQDGKSPLRISPEWSQQHGASYVAHPTERKIHIPGAPRRVELRLWEPERLSENLGAKAATRARDITNKYACSVKKTNEEIARCWSAASDTEREEAREDAERGTALFEQAYSHHARLSLLWQLGNLQVSVADFCNAAASYSRIDTRAATWTLPIGQSYLPVYESDAGIECARASQSPDERRQLIEEAIQHAERVTKELTQGSNEERARARRILGNWLLALRLLSDRPGDDLKVARAIRAEPELDKLWVEFRNATDALYRTLDFQDPETSAFIVAHRITEIQKQLKSQELPTAPTGIGGPEAEEIFLAPSEQDALDEWVIGSPLSEPE